MRASQLIGASEVQGHLQNVKHVLHLPQNDRQVLPLLAFRRSEEGKGVKRDRRPQAGPLTFSIESTRRD